MKILWAVDCFGGSLSSIKAGARFLKQIASSVKSQVQVYPVAIMGPMEFQWFVDSGIKESPQHYLEKLLRKFSMSELQFPKVISDSGFSLSSSAKALDAFGRKHQCELILCMTRSKPGIKNMILGSFAESLITRCKTSLFLVHPTGASRFQSRRALFSTDLSSNSKNAFKRFLPLAKELKSSVSVLHCAFQQSDWATTLAMAESFQYLSGLPLSMKESSFKKDQRWFVESAQKHGIKAKFLISRSYQHIAEEVIRTSSKERVDYIVSGTHSGPISAMVLGSTAKKILRLSSRPVLVIK